MAEPGAIAPVGPSPKAILSAFGSVRKGAALAAVRTISTTVAGGIKPLYLHPARTAAPFIPPERGCVGVGEKSKRKHPDSVTTPCHPLIPEDRKETGPVCLIEMPSE